MSIENIIIISWFLIGLITGTIIILLDMRGEEFDEDYFSSENIIFYLVSILLGYIITFIFIGIFQKSLSNILSHIFNSTIVVKLFNI